MKKKPPKGRIKNQKIQVAIFPGDEAVMDPTPLERFPDHAMTIACIIAEWSQIEYKLAVWAGLRLSEDRLIMLPLVYSLETSRARLDVTSTALRQLVGDHPHVKGRLDKVLKTAANLLALRNKYAHAHFGRDGDTGELAIAAIGKNSAINVPIHEVKHHLNEMKTLSHELSLIVATEIGLPLKGPDALDSVPAHPLGLHGDRRNREPQAPPPPSGASPLDDV